jgi:UDP-glucose 4-epimerase
MRIGITGASGFIGSVLLDRLVELQSHDVDVYALTRTVTPGLTHDDRIEWRKGDLSSYHECLSFVEQLEVIVHLAHTNSPFTSNNDLPGDAVTNMLPLTNLIQAVREAGNVPHVVYVSTGGALYHVRSKRPLSEKSPVEPTTSYGIQKLMGEHYFRLAAQERWLTATVLRIGNAYGAILPPERLQGFIGVALAQILAQKPIHVFGDPQNVRDYVHIEDVMRMFDLAITRRGRFDIYNVGSGEGRSVRDVLDALRRFTGIEPQVVYEPPSPNSHRLPLWIVLDVSKARRELGWTPQISFEVGVQALCDHAIGRQK